MELSFSRIASLIGDPARAEMLWALLDGKAYTATELALSADISPQNASMHLSKLVNADILTVEKQGRHRYYRFARQEVAYAVEAIANLVPRPELGPAVPGGIEYCRTCYDHLAGRVAVLLIGSLLKNRIVVEDRDGYIVTPKGEKWFASLGIDTHALKEQKRAFARKCLDWSERRHHLAGALGAALLESMLSAGWMRRVRHSREMIVTAKGQQAVYELLRITI